MLQSTQLPMHPQALSRDHEALASFQNARSPKQAGGKLRETFHEFVGETFFQMMLKSMRKMHGEPAYLHGGQAEEIFQGQLDQHLANDLARNAGGEFSNDLFHRFQLQLEQSDRRAIQIGNPTSSDASKQTPQSLEDLQNSNSTDSSSVKEVL